MTKYIAVLVLTSKLCLAQLGDQTYLAEYKKAVQLFANGQYDTAAQKFFVLSQKSYTNPIVPYAYFYNALSQKNKGNQYQARLIFRQLFETYADWDKINEARIIYADLNFKDEFYLEGLKSLDLVLDPSYKIKKAQLLSYYIPKIEGLSLLKDLYTRYPSEELLAKRIVETIQKNRYSSKDDLELSDRLTNRFKINIPKTNNKNTKTSIKPSEGIDIGLLLPFSIQNNQAGIETNKYIYDFYEGMLLGAERLKEENIQVEFHNYDIGKDAKDFNDFEKSTSNQKLDLIIGPLYASSNAAAQAFAEKKSIYQVHPFSVNKALVEKAKYSILAQSSQNQQIIQMLAFGKKNNTSKSVSIVYSSTKKDSIFADLYAQEAKKQGMLVSTFKPITTKSLQITRGISHLVYVGSDSDFIKYINILKAPKAKLMAFISEGVLQSLGRHNLEPEMYFVHNEYIEINSTEVKLFQKQFFEKMNSLPSYYAYLGYDISKYFGRMLKNGQGLFKINMESSFYQDDYLTGGFDLSKKIKDNNYFRLLHYNGSTFENVTN